MAVFKKFDPRASRNRSQLSQLSQRSPLQSEKSDRVNRSQLSQLSQGSPLESEKSIVQNTAKTLHFPDVKSEKSRGTPAKVAKVANDDVAGSLLPSLDEAFAALEQWCPDYVEEARWRVAVMSGRRFLEGWSASAAALGWTAEELFGLHTPPAKPHPSYDRLARYDCTGLIWLLSGNPVVALTADTATIRHDSGSITVYRKHNKPALGPLGDSMDDFV